MDRKVAFFCINDSTHVFKLKSHIIEGISCPICKSRVDILPVNNQHYENILFHDDLIKQTSNSKLEMKTGSVNDAPTIIIDGEVITEIISFHHFYTTKTDSDHGEHEYSIEYFDKKENVIKKISRKRFR